MMKATSAERAWFFALSNWRPTWMDWCNDKDEEKHRAKDTATTTPTGKNPCRQVTPTGLSGIWIGQYTHVHKKQTPTERTSQIHRIVKLLFTFSKTSLVLQEATNRHKLALAKQLKMWEEEGGKSCWRKPVWREGMNFVPGLYTTIWLKEIPHEAQRVKNVNTKKGLLCDEFEQKPNKTSYKMFV